MHLLQSENSPFTEGILTVYTFFSTESTYICHRKIYNLSLKNINFVTEKFYFAKRQKGV